MLMLVSCEMMRKCVLTLLLLTFTPSGNSQQSNVCKNLEDYISTTTNANCWYNPNVGASPDKIVTRYGYSFENYSITTEDGYIINLFRIPNENEINQKPPVLLQHGLGGDISAWFNLDEKSFPFVLANSGFDVWISSSRGTKYSSNHVKYTVQQAQYWNFSFHEMGIYDMPAVIDFIISKTGQKVTCVAHSMGTTVSYVYASLKPEHATSNLKTIISLGPLAYLDHAGSLPIRAILPFRNLIFDFLEKLGLYGIGPNIQIQLDALHNFCSASPTLLLCSIVHFTFTGKSESEEIYETFPVAFAKYPSGISLKTMKHYAQLMSNGPSFKFFDYGPDNIKIYNSTTPPEYPLSQIQIPVHLFYGNEDFFTKAEDVSRLYNDLKIEKSIQAFNFSHYNYLAAQHSQDFYHILLDKINSYL